MNLAWNYKKNRLIYETYIVVRLFQWKVLSTDASHAWLSKVKTRRKISILILVFIFQPQTIVPEVFSYLDAGTKEISTFQNVFNCALEEILP